MNMNWLNIKYIGRAGLIIILLFFTCPSSATCKTDTVINTYKRDSLYFAVKADSIIALSYRRLFVYYHQGRHCATRYTQSCKENRL